jgi:hypothetical protein
VSARGLLAAAAVAAALGLSSAEAQDNPIGGFFQHLFGGPPQQPPPSPRPSEASPSPRPTVAHKRKKSPPREASAPSAPSAPSTPPPTASKFVYVLGDSLAISAADGMVDDLQAKPDIGVIDRARDASGLVRDDYFDWTKAVRDLVGAREPAKEPVKEAAKPGAAVASPAEKPAAREKVDVVVVLLGINDIQAIKDGAAYVDPLTDRWKQLYAQRIQALVAPLHGAHVPVVWVGLPPMRSEKFNAQMIALNQMFKDNAERAGAKFIDIFDDFADQSGGFDAFGPNVEGQKVKLRGADGIHLTPAGGKKLAHFLDAEVLSALGESEPAQQPSDIAMLPPDIGKANDINEQIRREMGEPGPFEAALPPASEAAPAAVPAKPAPKPEAGAIASLAARPVSAGAQLISGARAKDAVEALRKGEPPPVEPGRADDFSR